MQSVLGWVRVFERSALDPALQARAVRTIERNVRRQSQLVNDMLDVSRIVAGKLTIEASEVDLSSLVEQTVEEIAPEVHDKAVTLETNIAPALHVRADHERFHQVLLNVLGNAVKFTPSGGRICVSCRGTALDATVTVSDTGVGIDPELIPEIFDRFRQGDTSSTRRHEGLGLGLSIAKHIVEQHGGTITAESAGAGAGSTFTIRVPLASQTGRALTAGAAASVQLDLSGVDVLIVDDHPDTLELLQFVVEASGARTWCAASVGQALALFETQRPSVVISDLSMPDQDGFDLLTRIRALGGPRVPAVALTGLADAGTRARVLAGGFDAHLAKPVEPQALVATIRELLQIDHVAAVADAQPPAA
jgi:CheY-like chemotaxis protein/two-component sensor histidine kinase